MVGTVCSFTGNPQPMTEIIAHLAQNKTTAELAVSQKLVTSNVSGQQYARCSF